MSAHPSTQQPPTTSNKATKAKLVAPRPIRSYAIRGRSLTKRQQRALELYGEHYLVQASQLNYHLEAKQNQFDVNTLFKRQATLVMEIGFGMGHSLLEDIRHYPEHNFLGIEVHAPGVANVIAGAYESQCHNLKVIRHDAKEIIQHAIPDNSIDKIQILFPDPWPKAKHHKRRMLQTSFIELLSQKIKDHGCLHLATDHAGYAEFIQQQLANCTQLQSTTVDSLPQDARGELFTAAFARPATKYEQRGLRLGHRIKDFVLIKKP